jgi:hypothetical protein
MDIVETIINKVVDLVSENISGVKYLKEFDSSKKSLIIFVVVFILYLLYTIRNNVLPGLLVASAIAGIYFFNQKKIKEYIEKYNLDKIDIVKKLI